MDEVKVVKEWYDENAPSERNRLEGFWFEFEHIKVMLKRHMKPDLYSIYAINLISCSLPKEVKKKKKLVKKKLLNKKKIK